jgi:tetratricopeptide (TPR) repeat protein
MIDSIIAGIISNIAILALSYYIKEKEVAKDILDLMLESIKNKLREKREFRALELLENNITDTWTGSQFELLVNILSSHIKNNCNFAEELKTFNHEYQTILENYLENPNKIGDRLLEGNTRLVLGNIYFYQNEFDKAINMYEKSSHIFMGIGDKHGEGKTLMNLANIYVKQKRYDEALSNYESSLDKFSEIGDKNSQGEVLRNKAILYRKEGLLDKSIDCYRTSLNLYSENDELNEIKVNLNIANILFDKNDLNAAALIYKHYLPKLRTFNDTYELDQALINYGTIQYSVGNLDKAIENYEECLFIRRNSDDKRTTGKVHLNLGNAHLKKMDVENATKHYLMAQDLFCSIRDPHLEGITLLSLFYAYQPVSNKRACEKLRQALSLLDSESEEYRHAKSLFASNCPKSK